MRHLVTHAIAALALSATFASAASADDNGLHPLMTGVIASGQPLNNIQDFGEKNTDALHPLMTGVISTGQPLNAAQNLGENSTDNVQPPLLSGVVTPWN